MDDMDLNLYVIAEIRYQKEHENEDNIFPIDWYSSQNYKLKTEIIAEAIKNHTTIEQTNLYNEKFKEKIKFYEN